MNFNEYEVKIMKVIFFFGYAIRCNEWVFEHTKGVFKSYHT